MKTGIITFHNTLNPGAALQAYALCRYLRTIGIDCDIVDYRCPNIIKRELSFRRVPSVIKTVVLRTLIWPLQKEKMREFLSFLPDEGMISKKIYTPENISEANRDYGAFIAGSDQVWNMEITDGDVNFFLDFVHGGLRFAYAASVGDLWSPADETKIGELIKSFDAIGVREDSARDIIKERFGAESTLVCDPTMLITPDQWEELAEKPHETGYVLVYMPDDITDSIAAEYAEKCGKKLIRLGDGGFHLKRSGLISADAGQWIGYILNADSVFTDSYHGLLFSLYFGKKVWTCFSEKRGERQKTLLRRINAEYCHIGGMSEIDENIDIGDRSERIQLFREQSQKWITDNLSACLENE